MYWKFLESTHDPKSDWMSKHQNYFGNSFLARTRKFQQLRVSRGWVETQYSCTREYGKAINNRWKKDEKPIAANYTGSIEIKITANILKNTCSTAWQIRIKMNAVKRTLQNKNFIKWRLNLENKIANIHVN